MNSGILARMSDSTKFGSVALECPDARQLAAFYAEITGGTVTSADEQPGDHFRVYADPAGHPFCLCIEGALS
jgi:hypothetical protein